MKVANGYVDELLGNKMVCVFHSAYLAPADRGNGLGRKGHEERLAWAKKNGYDYAICTVLHSNAAEIHILQSHGWRKLEEITPNGVEPVYIYGRHL